MRSSSIPPDLRLPRCGDSRSAAYRACMLANRSTPESLRVAGDVFGSKASLHHFAHTSRSRSPLACITDRTTCSFLIPTSLIFGQGGASTSDPAFPEGNFDADSEVPNIVGSLLSALARLPSACLLVLCNGFPELTFWAQYQILYSSP